jgi:DNA-binding FadR family transcriptional regulator
MRLQQDGLVYSRKGAGTFVRMRPPARLGDFAEPAHVASYLRSFEVRTALEGEAARLAALRRTRSQLEAINDAARALADAFGRRQTGHDEDYRFHAAVADATDNELFPRPARRARRHHARLDGDGARPHPDRLGDRRKQVLKEHWQICDAIAAQDGEAATLNMRYHLLQTRLRTTDARREL